MLHKKKGGGGGANWMDTYGDMVTLLLCFFPNLFGGDGNNNLTAYNAIVSAILLITLLFANFAEAVAEGRGKAQAESLTGKPEGPWKQLSPIFMEDGGHGMIFTDKAGKRRLALHQPNGGNLERARFFYLVEKDGRLAAE